MKMYYGGKIKSTNTGMWPYKKQGWAAAHPCFLYFYRFRLNRTITRFLPHSVDVVIWTGSESGIFCWSTSCTYNVLFDSTGAVPRTNSKPEGPYSLLMPLTVCCSTVLPFRVPRSTTTVPIIGLLLASTTVPPIPAQLQASSGWMMVLSTCVNDPPNGALGVLVGLAVLVGGTRENGVSVGSGVMVGRGVSLGVTTRVGLAVHVARSWMGVTVIVGTLLPKIPSPGGRMFSEEAGLI